MTETLNRRFTPLDLLMLSINGMVGSAWLFAPFYAARIAGSGALLAWLIGGAATAIIALTFTELAVLFPVVGGTAQIPRISHGAFASFVMSWMAWLSALTMAPIEVQAILQYAANYFPSLMILKKGVLVLSGQGYLWATGLMLSFCIINLTGYRGLMRWNLAVFLFKVAVMILVAVMLLTTTFHPENFSGLFSATLSAGGWQSVLTAVSAGGVAFAFTGFKHGVELAGESRRIAVTLPVAIVGSIICCLLLYFGLQVAFIGAISPAALAQGGWKSLEFAGDAGPFAGLAAGMGLLWLARLLYLDSVVSPAGAALVYVTSTARILYAMSELGYVPRKLSALNRQGFPAVAILTNFVVGMLVFLPFPGWQGMVSFLVSGMVISYAMGPVALLSLRRELPDTKRGFRLPAATLISASAFYFCNLLCYWTGWETIYKLALAILAGMLFFAVSLVFRGVKLSSSGLKSACWIVPWLAGLVVISWLGAFGGRHIIPFGWDFLVILIFSSICLIVAVKTRTVRAEAGMPDLPAVAD